VFFDSYPSPGGAGPVCRSLFDYPILPTAAIAGVVALIPVTSSWGWATLAAMPVTMARKPRG
jgi:hypothetical protein